MPHHYLSPVHQGSEHVFGGPARGGGGGGGGGEGGPLEHARLSLGADSKNDIFPKKARFASTEGLLQSLQSSTLYHQTCWTQWASR